MNERAIGVGTLVVNRGALEWGPGKVVSINGPQVKIYFRDRDAKGGESPVVTLRLPEAPIEAAAEQTDPWFDHVPRDRAGEPVISRYRMSLSQAVEKFRGLYPGGFEDPAYAGDARRGDRDTRWQAHTLWVDTLGDRKGLALSKAGDVEELKRLAMAVVEKLGTWAKSEAAALQEGLADTRAAAVFFRTLLSLLVWQEPEKKRFDALATAALGLPIPPGKGKSAPDRWAIVTLLPFVARPDTYMLLRSDTTKRAAEILGFDLRYEAHPNWRTYRQLHRLGELLMKELKPLGARDWIDVHSFMSVVCEKP